MFHIVPFCPDVSIFQEAVLLESNGFHKKDFVMEILMTTAIMMIVIYMKIVDDYDNFVMEMVMMMKHLP